MSDHVPPAAPVVLQLMWQLKGSMLGQTYYVALLLPVCLSKQQHLSDNTTAEQSHWVTQK